MIFNSTFKNYLKKNSKIQNKILIEEFNKSELNNVPLYKTLIDDNLFKEDEIYNYLSKFLGIEYKSIQLSELNLELIKKFPLDKLIINSGVPYFEANNFISVGASNPIDFEDLKSLKGYVGKQIQIFLISESNSKKILDYISNKYLQTAALNESPIITDTKKDDNIDLDAPVIKICDSILREAVDLSASDIHIEPFEDIIRVRFRIDGILVTNQKIKLSLFPAVLARFKIMASMNIAERRIPQDGKISLNVNDIKYDFRVSTLPTIYGEKIVIRIYNSLFKSADFKALGFDEEQENLILKMITRPHGIILLTGPTGSGKSTTLYSFLRYLNNDETNIITVEDPVENQIYGINQVQVNNKADLTFSSALRSILRQDPNVIMIGEIRDEETASIATRAAITGHLVLSTIHTNDAVGVVARLMNMGIQNYLISDALLGSISQRLVRRLCNYCKKEDITTEEEMKGLHIDTPHIIYRPCGCRMCNNSGYSGRVALFEIMVNSKALKEKIMSNSFTALELEKIAKKDGMISLLDEAKKHVLSGDTSYSEYEGLSEVVSD